ncbi:hypothetical protein CsatB_004089 [Cannabis sativa]
MFTNVVNYFGLHLFDIFILLFVAAFTLIWFQWITKKLSSVPLPPLPPGPRGLPIVGYFPYLSQNLHIDLTALGEVYGPIYKFWMGTKLCVVINSPQLVAQVGREQDIIFSNRDVGVSASIISQGGLNISFQPYGTDWKKLRKILVREMLNNSVLDNLTKLRRQEVRKSVKCIYEKRESPVNIALFTYQTTINCVIGMTIGTSLEENESVSHVDGSKFKKAVEELFELLAKPNISDIFPMLKWFDIQKIGRDTERINQVFEMVFDDAIAKKKKKAMKTNGNYSPILNESTTKDILQSLVELHLQPQDKDTYITIPEIKAILMDIFVAATDTITTSVEWAMTEIMRNPNVLNKVNEELKQVVGLNNTLEESHLSKLTYLNAVYKETLRIHPPGPFLIPRSSSQSTIVGGYTIPKGTAIFLNVWSIQRDPSVWENPLEFLPERFLMSGINGSSNNGGNNNEYNFSGNTFDYIPFGTGRRICPGASLGERMSLIILASFLHYFHWKLPNDTELELSDKFGLALKKRAPLIAIPTPKYSDLELYTTISN